MSFPRNLLEDAALCLLFFTRLPLPHLDPAGRGLAPALWAAPLAGAVVGAIGALAFAAAAVLGLPPAIAAALALSATVAATGCLHEDGLSDVADGFWGGRTRERRLEIMRDSRIGAFGAAALILSFLLRWSALASLPDARGAALALLAAHAASRATLPAFLHLARPARPDGLGAGAAAVPAASALAAAALGLAALLPLGLGAAFAVALLLALLALAFRALCLEKIGGQTGDCAGALQQLGEILTLTAAVAVLA